MAGRGRQGQGNPLSAHFNGELEDRSICLASDSQCSAVYKRKRFQFLCKNVNKKDKKKRKQVLKGKHDENQLQELQTLLHSSII